MPIHKTRPTEPNRPKELTGRINKQAVIISTLGGQYGGVNYFSPDAQNVEPGKRYIIFALGDDDKNDFSPILASELKAGETFVVTGYPMVVPEGGKTFTLNEVIAAIK